MKIADLAKDQAILSEARQLVIQIFNEDPNLKEPQHQLLSQYLNRSEPAISWDKIS
jgi:ATP-dependent DNA helicase RecG